MEVELIKKKKNKKPSLIIGILIVIAITLGVSFAFFKYSKTADNQQLVVIPTLG